MFEEPLIKDKRKPQLRRMVYKLIDKLEANEMQDIYLFKVKRERDRTRERTRKKNEREYETRGFNRFPPHPFGIWNLELSIVPLIV